MRNEHELMLLVRRDGGLPRHLPRWLEHAEAGRRETAALASLAESEPWLRPHVRPSRNRWSDTPPYASSITYTV